MKFTSKNLKSWLEKETGSTFIPVHARAEKHVEEIRKSLEGLTEISKSILENSAKEIEKRNMKTYRRARALNKLARLFVERWKQVKVPENISYDSVDVFIGDVQKAFTVTEVDVRNWFPRISPFFILDRRKFLAIFERAKESLKGLTNFHTKEYVKTKTLEETFQLIDKVASLEHSMSLINDQILVLQSQEISVESEIAEIEQKMAGLKIQGSVGQLSQTGTEIDALCVEVKHSLQHLQKPFIKLQSLAMHGGGSGLTPEELTKLNRYVEDPFDAFSTEGPGLPLLKQILRKMGRSISEGKLKLKPEKVRKAQQLIEAVVDKESMVALHERCVDAVARRKRLSTSTEVAVVQQDLTRLQEQLHRLMARKGVLEGEEHNLRINLTETLQKTQNHREEIRKNVLSFTGKDVQIE